MKNNEEINEPVYSDKYDPETGFEPQEHPSDDPVMMSVAILTQAQFFYPVGSFRKSFDTFHLKQKRQHHILIGRGDAGIGVVSYRGWQFSQDFQSKIDVGHPEIQNLLTEETAPDSGLFFIYHGLIFTNTVASLPVVDFPEPNTADRINKLERIISSVTSEADKEYFQKVLEELKA